MPKPKVGEKTTNINAGAPAKKVREPLADAVNWERRLLRGPMESRLAAVKEAGESRDERAVGPLVQMYHDLIVQHDDRYEFCRKAIDKIREKALPELMRLMENDELRWCAANSILGLVEEGVDCRVAVPALISALKVENDNDPIEPSTLVRIGKPSIEPVRKAFAEALMSGDEWLSNHLQDVLERLTDSEKVFQLRQSVERERDARLELENLGRFQRAVYEFISENKNAKMALFENSGCLDSLKERQSWITVNDPMLARQALELAMQKAGAKRSAFENLLKNVAGFKISEIGESHYRNYADEILDAVAQYVRGSALARDPEMASVVSKIRYGEGIRLRYIKRETADLSLGDKCGDCTAKGSVNFANSISWLANPAYQILKMYSGKRFIGRLNLALGKVDGKDAIIIDATEFNPQAEEGGTYVEDGHFVTEGPGPYYEEGKKCFQAALEFARELAARQGRALYAYNFSNSGGASEIYSANCIGTGQYKMNILAPVDEVKQLLGKRGYGGKVSLFYQCLSYENITTRDRQKNVAEEARNRRLESEVLNPAQMGNSEIGAAMRDRNFVKAAAAILADSGYEAKVRAIFGVSPEYAISPKLLEGRMKEIYPENLLISESLSKTFESSNIIRLA